MFENYFVEFREKLKGRYMYSKKEKKESWSIAMVRNDIKITKEVSKLNNTLSFHFETQIAFELPNKDRAYEFRAFIYAKCPFTYAILSNIRTYRKMIKVHLVFLREKGHYLSYTTPKNLLKNDDTYYISKEGSVNNDWIIWRISKKNEYPCIWLRFVG